MDKFAVVSTNANPNYFYYAPLVEWAWNRLGYRLAIFITDDVDPMELHLNTPDSLIFRIPSFTTPEGRDKMTWHGTLAQVSRHYASTMMPKNSYIITSDIDMIPLIDFLKPDYGKRTVWGWDLTGRSFIPVSYVGMQHAEWQSLMECTYDIKGDMEKAMKMNGRAYKTKWEEYWDADWEILTTQVLKQKDRFTFIDRGKTDGFASKRGDRWFDKTYQQSELWDLHLENDNPSHPEKFTRMHQAIKLMCGEPPSWMKDHASQHHYKYGKG